MKTSHVISAVLLGSLFGCGQHIPATKNTHQMEPDLTPSPTPAPVPTEASGTQSQASVQQQEVPQVQQGSQVEVKNASVELLQGSVARIVTELEIDGKPVTIYQDSYSSLYSVKREDSVGPSLILYYSPVFTAGEVKLRRLNDTQVEIIVTNKRNAAGITEAIRDHLNTSFPKDLFASAQIAQLPVRNVSGKIQVFGGEYEAKVSSDFGLATAIVPASALPAVFKDEGKAPAIRDYVTALPVSYTYFVLPFSEDQCRLNIDSTDLSQMFGGTQNEADGEKCKNASTLPEKAQCLSSQSVTFSLARDEVKKLKARMDIRCTASAGGMGWKTIDELLQKMLAKGTDMMFPSSPDKWDEVMQQIALNTVGSPEKFISTLDQVSDCLNTGESLNQAFSSSTEAKAIAKYLSEYDSRRQSTYASASRRQESMSAEGAADVDVFGFGGGSASGAYSSSSSSEDASASHSKSETRARDAGESGTQYAHRINSVLEKNGYTARVQEINGKLKFVPSVRLTLKNQVSRESSLIAGLSNTQRGIIVKDTAQTNVNFEGEKIARVVFEVDCDGNVFQQSESIVSPTWHKRHTVIFANMSKEFNENSGSPLVTLPGCANLTVRGKFKSNDAGRSLLPQELEVNVSATSVGANNATRTQAKKIKLQSDSSETGVLKFNFEGSVDKWKVQLSLGSLLL